MDILIGLVLLILVASAARVAFLFLTGRETLQKNERFLVLLIAAFSVAVNLIVFVPSVREQQVANQKIQVSNQLTRDFQEKFLLNRSAEDQEFYSDVLQLTIRRSVKAEEIFSRLLGEEIPTYGIPLGNACKKELDLVVKYRNLTPFCKLEGLQIDEDIASSVEESKEILFGREQNPE